MPIRRLDPIADRARVEALFAASADYVQMERDQDPGPQITEDFFADAPPGADPAASHRVGLFQPDLIGIAELSFGYPDALAAYIGLLMIAPPARGKGAGQRLLRHLEDTARRRGAKMLYLAVLDANQRGRAFWQREGFSLALANCSVTPGRKTQIAHRLGKPL